MRAVIQRVSEARVRVEGREVAAIRQGVVVLLGVARDDTSEDVEAIAGKVRDLRLFEDSVGKMSLSARDVRAEVLMVSQFTLYGDCRRGRRPSFDEAAPPAQAKAL
jgi:D-tyrosyl-tRNA(Tyr) deacylase